jgi:virginiamycin A acetyltransferase
LSLLLKISNKILSFIDFRLVAKPRVKKHINIIESKVTHSDLIDDRATVQFSELRGPITIGPYSIIHKAILEGPITVGRNTTVNGPSTEFYCLKNPITIGSFCSIARGTSIQEYNHNWKSLTTYFIRHRIFNEKYGVDTVSKGRVTIGNDVWIGAQCVLLSGVSVGDGAVIAANSVVAHDVPSYAIVGGSPAKVIRYRFERPVIEKLIAIKWWLWDDKTIKENKDLFMGDLTLEKLNRINEPTLPKH